MELRQVDQAGRSHAEAAELRLGRARAGVIPRSDHEMVRVPRLRGSVGAVLPVMHQRAGLVGVVNPCDGENWNRDRRVFGITRVVSVPVGALLGLSDPLLEGRARV